MSHSKCSSDKTCYGRVAVISNALNQFSPHFIRYGLVLVLVWIGGMKFTAYEAGGIKPFVENSPLMSFVYHIMSVRDFSRILGCVEILIAGMIALMPWFTRISVVGSGLSVGMFLTTLTFLVTTPGAFEPSEGGFPALSVPGQFLIKDVVLLAAAVFTLSEALKQLVHRASLQVQANAAVISSS